MRIDNYDFPDHIKGNTFTGAEFTVNVNDSALNLTGASIEMSLKVWDNENETSVLDLSCSITDAVNGVFEVDSQIIDVPAHCYVYDIKITLSNGDVKTYIRGNWTIIQNIT